MGKMGAGELNYSSDIDLIVFFDPDATTLLPRHRAAAVLRARHAGAWRASCSSGPVTATSSASICGCARTRPRPRSRSRRDAALNYYEREGRTWERAAMIKARACAGDAVAGDALLAEHRAVRLAQASRLRRARRRPRHEAADADLSRPERDHGRGPQCEGRPRRHPRDRVLRPDPAADRRRPASRVAGAADAGRHSTCSPTATGSPTEARDELSTAYEFLRRVEHRIQMIADEQTHALPDDKRGGGAPRVFLRL